MVPWFGINMNSVATVVYLKAIIVMLIKSLLLSDRANLD